MSADLTPAECTALARAVATAPLPETVKERRAAVARMLGTAANTIDDRHHQLADGLRELSHAVDPDAGEDV